jgi:hypothetical protein
VSNSVQRLRRHTQTALTSKIQGQELARVQTARTRITVCIMRECLLLWEYKCFERVQLSFDKLIQLVKSVLRNRLIRDNLR